jgi:hypothetical protein
VSRALSFTNCPNKLSYLYSEEKLLIKRLKPVDTGHILDRGCMSGTREALLNNIVEWALRPSTPSSNSQSSGTESVYWLYGIPGVGKTSVAHSLCARLHEKKRLGGSFFCRRDDPNLSNPSCVLPTLICKLAGTWRPFKKLIADKLRDDEHLNRNSAGYALLPQLLDSLQNSPKNTLVLVIDALDECGDNQGRNSILTSLINACSRAKWLKIIITSRQEHDIESSFKRLEHTCRYLSKDLKADDKAEGDIRLFVQRKFSIIAQRRYLEDDWPGEDRRGNIVSRSGGLFIFADTLWRLLKDDLNPDIRLTNVLSGTSGDALSSLYNLYSSAIESKVGRNIEEFRMAMEVIITVGQYRPLCDESVARLADLSPSVVKGLVDELSSLLYRDTNLNGGIRVRHLSIIDFLAGSECLPELRVNPEQANRSIGRACIGIMTDELKFNICKLESSLQPNQEIEDLREKIDQNISDTLQYSCIFWSNHICHSIDIGDLGIYQSLDRFVEKSRLLYWMEILSLLGQVAVGDSSLRRLLSWTKVFSLFIVIDSHSLQASYVPGLKSSIRTIHKGCNQIFVHFSNSNRNKRTAYLHIRTIIHSHRLRTMEGSEQNLR